MLCTLFLASKEAHLCEKCDNLFDFDDKLSVISLLLEILHRLNAISIAFYTPNTMHAVYRVETCPNVRKMRPFTRFWRQTERYFAIVGDISTFERYFHRILQAECYARRFYSRNMPNCTQNATIYSILTTHWALFRVCWRYFDVYTLFPLYFTRRVLCTPVSSSKEADLCEKFDHLLDFEENCALYRSCWRYFDV